MNFFYKFYVDALNGKNDYVVTEAIWSDRPDRDHEWKENNKTRLDTPKEIEKTIHPYQLVGNMIMIAAVSGIIGAKIFANLENWDEFLDDPWGQLFSFSGLTFYGGLILGTISIAYYAKKYNIKLINLVDVFAPALILAYGIGRIGCHLSGDGDWGIVNTASKPEWMSFLPDWMWSYNYSHNVLTSSDFNERVISGEMTYIDGCSGTFWDPFCYLFGYLGRSWAPSALFLEHYPQYQKTKKNVVPRKQEHQN